MSYGGISYVTGSIGVLCRRLENSSTYSVESYACPTNFITLQVYHIPYYLLPTVLYCDPSCLPQVMSPI